MVRASSVPGASRQRVVDFRMVALASAVVLAVVLPLAVASAGPVGAPGREKARAKPDSAKNPGAAPLGRGGPRPAGFRRPGAPGGLLGADSGDAPDPSGVWDATAPGLSGLSADSPTGIARCGPELASPEGVEAQTCVIERARDTWARTYYRNATGAPLAGVLTLMAPDGRTVQVNCRLSATDDPDMCETPRRPTVRGHGSYAAVAEIASTEGKLLLRSGSNSGEAEEG